MLNKVQALKRLGMTIGTLLLLVVIFVYLFDPFYMYHEPYMGMKTVLFDRDYQVPGSIRSLSYDSVILGSSVAENFDSSYLDEQYGCETLKVIKSSGSVADLLYYLDIVHKQRELKRVFWCMDIFAFTASNETTFYREDSVQYLHTANVLDDAPYLFNKDVLFMKIPQSLAYSLLDRNTGGKGYDWSEDKTFSSEQAMKAYDKPKQCLEQIFLSEEKEPDYLEQNLQMVLQEIEAHPEIEYVMMFPPYSMLWWDCGYVNGVAEEYFQVLEKALPQLCMYDNVKVYFFQAENDIICNLDYYMDMIHYSPQVNQHMLECVVADTNRVTPDNVEMTIQEMREVYEYIIEEGIYRYYEK